MGQLAPRVCTETSAVERLEALIVQLPGNARVAVECEDGKQRVGIVCVRPSIQTFRDRDSREGSNGVLRLQDAAAPGGEHHIWLDQIKSVKRLMAYVEHRAA